MQRDRKNASVVAALVIGAGTALALTSGSAAMWLAAGAAVGIVLAAVLSNVASDQEAKDSNPDHGKLRARS